MRKRMWRQYHAVGRSPLGFTPHGGLRRARVRKDGVAAKKRRPVKAKKKRSVRGRSKSAKTRATRGAKTSRKRIAPKAKKTTRSKSATGGASHGRRADYGLSVDEFVARLPQSKREIVNALRDIVREAVPGVAETIRWGMPVFARKKLICYASTKSDYVRFGFYARVELDDPEKRIAGSLAYVKLNDASDIERPLLHSWIQQVVEHTDA